jgi:hypothetical protein
MLPSFTLFTVGVAVPDVPAVPALPLYHPPLQRTWAASAAQPPALAVLPGTRAPRHPSPDIAPCPKCRHPARACRHKHADRGACLGAVTSPVLGPQRREGPHSGGFCCCAAVAFWCCFSCTQVVLRLADNVLGCALDFASRLVIDCRLSADASAYAHRHTSPCCS